MPTRLVCFKALGGISQPANPGLTSGLFVGIRFALADGGTKPDVRGLHPMVAFNFEPILVNSSSPGGARVLRTFDDIALFISDTLDARRRQTPHWQAVLGDLSQARFGARRAEVHAAMREALMAEGWIATG
jgi:hypothetical protein